MNIAVFCIFRDSEENLSNLFSTLEQIESKHSLSYFFYENDSQDNTSALIKEWLRNRDGKFLSEKLNAKRFSGMDVERMKFLCECRNKGKKLSEGRQFDYAFVCDADVEFSPQIVDDFLKEFDKNPRMVMATPNVRQNIFAYTENRFCPDSYYDVYAFKDRYGDRGTYFADCPSSLPDDIINWKNGKAIRVNSAFGGAALIKWEPFSKVKWHSHVHCDHVNFCYDLGQYGTIYSFPNIRTKVSLDLFKYDLNEFQQMGVREREIVDKIAKLWNK